MPRLDRPSLTAATANLLARRTSFVDTELHALTEVVRPGDVCVDVGSAAGLYSQALSHLAGPTGVVHSVEPVSFSHPVWSRVLGAWERTNVVRHPVALGAEPGRAAMRVPFRTYGPDTSRSYLDWNTHGLGSNAEFSHHADVLVEVDTLDGLHAATGLTRLDFVKIDVEGGELHVLRGGTRAIERYRPTLLIEIEARHTARYDYTPEDVVEWLTSRGYAMYAWRQGWQATGQVCLHTNNYLFRPRTGDPGSP
ncbi:FkbM family methyltransferase [Amycolatopsis magusensis]|uniref:FkbM family methyltransferase n=1 Tax=Amycolatopsis magusensis TaxID=882444 RepID=A0ABS4Q118_9PSEU|nr:FkbM family methyltransferase [Amycolatopsis magusensis]MBP2185358.1 FkbM family methyltransferase [Amycolatopsis magusensis]